MPSVFRLNLAPVKSLALWHPRSVDLTAVGAAENRLFYLVDPSGAMVTANAFGPMQLIRSAFDAAADSLTLTFPGGQVIEGPAGAHGDPIETDFYGRPVAAHVVEGPFADALSAYTGMDVRLARTDRPGDGSDVHHVTLVSSASIAALGAAGGVGDGGLDPRRFRMLIELDGCEPYEEDTWDGRRVRIGDAVLRICGQVPRCVITTQSPDTGLKDFDSLKTIFRTRGRMADGTGLPFGMYAEVDEPGRVRAGDPVEPLPN